MPAIERLAGLQAQWSPSPYLALWTPLERFAIADLASALERRAVVKATLMRGTLHLVSAREYPAYVTATAAARVAAWRTAASASGLDVPGLRDRLLRYASEPRSLEELVGFLETHVAPDPDRRRHLLWRLTSAQGWLVHAPPSGLWRSFRTGRYVAARAWLGPTAEPPLARAMAFLVERYLAAFGPATRADLAAWSGQRLASVLAPALAALGPRLRELVDERGRTLYDMRGAARPSAETAAPVRFLPKWDSLLLAHAATARERVLPERYRRAVIRRNGDVLPTFLVDGFVAGTWDLRRSGRTGTLTLSPFARLGRADRQALLEEGERLARFVEPDAQEWAVRE